MRDKHLCTHMVDLAAWQERESWVAEFAGLDEILDEEALIAGPGCAAHRIAPDGGPVCGRSADQWHRVATDDLGMRGSLPCGRCYRPVASWLADRDDSPVEYVGDTPSVEVREVEEVGAIADGGNQPPQLGSLTEEVLTASGLKTIHAPTDEGEPVCESEGDYRRVELAVLRGHGEPCGQCFALDEGDDTDEEQFVPTEG